MAQVVEADSLPYNLLKGAHAPMKCYCYEMDTHLVYCAEVANQELPEDAVLHGGPWKWVNGTLTMAYPLREINDPTDKGLVSENFAIFGGAMLQSMQSSIAYKKPLELLARAFSKCHIEWYLIGSTCDAVRGIEVNPGDIDIVIHTKDFGKVREICHADFHDSIIVPFSDNQSVCPLRCFGGLFLEGSFIEIAADEAWNRGTRQPEYEKYTWNGLDLYMESLQLRYKIEIARGRKDRIQAFENYFRMPSSKNQ